MKQTTSIPKFFATANAFRNWLLKNHQKKSSLLVGFYKTSSKKKSISWSESVDHALCFGWIDGVRTSINEESYQIRFIQRKPGSTWSAVNIKKMKVLAEQGMLQPAGLAAFEQRTAGNSNLYSHEQNKVAFSGEFEKQFKANKKAWAYFNTLAPSYIKQSTHWVMSAKQEATQLRRLQQLISDSSHGTNQWKNNKYKK